MSVLEDVTSRFVAESQAILGENLVGVYLHGSAAMGCFHEETSDIDLLVVVNEALSNDTKRRFMDMVVALNERATKKGIEMSIVRQAVCHPFVYPTPYELHFSATHLAWYQKDPEDYIAKMQGTDKDLAAHFTIVSHRGKCLCGRAIDDVFDDVPHANYMDSLWEDVKNAQTDVLENPTYVILNLCRVLAYRRKGLILSKMEGAQWALARIPIIYRRMLCKAVREYVKNQSPKRWDTDLTQAFATHMLKEIKKG